MPFDWVHDPPSTDDCGIHCHCSGGRRGDEASIQAATFCEVAQVAAAATASHVVLVTNEVGCGLVPESPVGRSFRDLQGWVNQEVARSADWVYQVVAGIPVVIKRPEGCR